MYLEGSLVSWKEKRRTKPDSAKEERSVTLSAARLTAWEQFDLVQLLK
jgi:hypothetical protein